ncbi:MAG: hypothetical protein DMG41_20425 [Acidobacteria bacterium]|jgi:hypothetical protein|nr:MAG: hypothetical protein AUH13_31070 [Acidobacteria bacterium 13_2_20CM_58_27]PYT71391.1 MAG: hypothetical protein DMG42_16685 [Acidobacteriota bacterium]PYT86242.1 MAG: hypothetical protein DMG41_20425 [Acidobacteriota bacterium]
MKTILASIITTVLIVAMTLAAMFALVWATVKVTSLPTPLERAVGMGLELLLGIVLLLGTTWLATHLAVRIFSRKEPPSADFSELSKTGFDGSSSPIGARTNAPSGARTSAVSGDPFKGGSVV